MITLRAAVQQIGAPRDPFVWEANKGTVNPNLAKQFQYGRRQNSFYDLLEYCWLVYSKALYAAGPQLIGRTGDLWVPKQLSKAGISDPNTQTLWDNFTQGNIQLMDKWSPTVNDCWVLGGVHRRADFELVSIRSLQNLWDYDKNLPIVTGREILGALHFGYELKEQPGRVRLVNKDPAAAQDATLEAYDAFMKQMQAKGANSIVSLLKMDSALQSQIQNFDRSQLKHWPR
jgi:hypothetical protein